MCSGLEKDEFLWENCWENNFLDKILTNFRSDVYVFLRALVNDKPTLFTTIFITLFLIRDCIRAFCCVFFF